MQDIRNGEFFFLSFSEETISEHDQDNTPVSADSEQFSRQERLRMLALRKHIDSLSNEVSNKESQVQTTRYNI